MLKEPDALGVVDLADGDAMRWPFWSDADKVVAVAVAVTLAIDAGSNTLAIVALVDPVRLLILVAVTLREGATA